MVSSITNDENATEEIEEKGSEVQSESPRDLEKPEAVALEVISTRDDPDLPVVTLRAIILGLGLSAFSSVLATIYIFKPANAEVSQLFCLIIAYVLGTALSALPNHGFWRYINPGPFNIKEHTFIVIMASTAASVALAMEIIAALDLFYDLRISSVVAIFSIFATQMIGYGIAGLLRRLLVYPTYAFYPTSISVVNLLQSLHFGGTLNSKRRRFFWIAFCGIFLWEWIPQYAFPLLTAISVVCMADNGRHDFVRNLFGTGSGNEGLGLLSFSTSWTLVTQGYPLVWPLQTPNPELNSYFGIAIGYAVLTGAYYANIFNGRDLKFMSTSLFGLDGQRYNQSAVIDSDFKLNYDALETVGLPRYTTTYAISQMCFNLSLGAAFTTVGLWHWPQLKAAFAGMRFLKSRHDEVDDPHYQAMRKYPEVPPWVYGALFLVSLAVGIGCSYAGPDGRVLVPAWSIIFFTFFSSVISVVLGLITATTGFQISFKYTIQVIAAFLHPGQPIPVMYANLFGNNLKLGQYTKVPPRVTFAAQLIGSVIGSIFNFTMMRVIVDNNRAELQDPVGGRVWSGWVIQQYNSASVALGAFGKELFAYGKPAGYWIIPFATLIGLFLPIPFWVTWNLSKPESKLAKAMAFVNVPVLTLYIGWLPYSVNGQWWTCLVIGVISQWWLRTRHPQWFVKYNYLLAAALDGGSQVILFILSFGVFGASGKAVPFPTWWGNSAVLSVDRCKAT